MFYSFRKNLLTAASLGLVLTGCSGDDVVTEAVAVVTSEAISASSVVSEANTAMGMQGLSAISYSGSAWRIRNSFRQTPNASPPWRDFRDQITNYVRTIDLSQAESLAVGDTFSQNLFFDPAVAGTYIQNIPADESEWNSQLEVWLTPWGFLNGAEVYNAELSSEVLDGKEYQVVTWKSPSSQVSPSGLQYTVTGYLNAEHLVERVETWVEDAFMGDMNVVALYSNYEELDGLMVPMTIEQQRGGGSIFGVDVAAVRANPANLEELLTLPDVPAGNGFGGGGAPPVDLVEQLAEGVYLIKGGYVALAVEFEDYIAVFESGQSEERGETILSEVKGAIPGKEIRYIVNSHPHSDHTAGLIPFVREGAMVITHENNVDFLTMALTTPRTLLGEETLSPTFDEVEEVMVLEDSTMRLEFHHILNGHSDGMLVAYLPEQGILFQADFTLPQPGAEANPFVVNLAEYVAETGLEFEQYLAVHAAQDPQTKADLMATIGQ